jgi:cytoplasmic iron level regulating protein YaaA (DUF328/UPF0246 family)
MILLLSPAKALDFSRPIPYEHSSQPLFLSQASQLVGQLKKLSLAEIASLMGVSDKLAALNLARYAEWSPPFTSDNARAAIFAFDGDVYEGLQAHQLSAAQLDWAQQHLRILSGLYGVLRPLDLIQAYRLEMGTRLRLGNYANLYQFWANTLPSMIQQMLDQGDSVLVNLASEEYFKAVQAKTLRARIITPVFEDWNGGRYKIVSFYAKRARGLMSRYAIEHQVEDPEALKLFDVDGYAFDPAASVGDQWVFRRNQE